MIISCIIYAAKTREEYLVHMGNLTTGFGLCISAGILSILAGALYITESRRNANAQPASDFQMLEP